MSRLRQGERPETLLEAPSFQEGGLAVETTDEWTAGPAMSKVH